MSDSNLSLGSPLVAMPSVLALPGLRRRTDKRLKALAYDERQVAIAGLLGLDPLATVRGLRTAAAALYGSHDGPWSVATILRRLGPTLTPRLLDTPVATFADTEDLELLWLRALATALAAQQLAEVSGVVPPETGYLLGLLHDMPAWLRQIDVMRGMKWPGADAAYTAWIRRWQLPSELATSALSSHELRASGQAGASPIDDLLAKAERLAALADFPHPERPGEADGIAETADRGEFMAARNLRRSVQALLDAHGLDVQPGAAPLAEVAADDQLQLVPADIPLEEVLLNVLYSRTSGSYRGIITALLAAALRYGDFDRVIYAKYVHGRGLQLRSKAELASRRMVHTSVEPTAHEGAELRRALADERPVLLDAADDDGSGILSVLGADQVLAVVVNRELATPAFLLFDRAARHAPLQLARDAAIALTIGQTGSLLKENLLLRRRRERAEITALTDALTGLQNRRMAVMTLERELARSARSGAPLTVLLCDLDHFKKLNDRFGHLVGDHALRTVADLLKKCIRKTDSVARFGGEEFLVLLPETPPEDAAVLAARIFTEVESTGA
ncbi:MAG: hypothetical protein RL398_727, partial [Planctomycetota bacterium]